MYYEEFKTLLNEVGKKLYEFNFNDYSPHQAIQLVLECETALFRARIKLERNFNHK